jgi:hypothetical protein
MRWTEQVTSTGDMGNKYSVLVGRPEQKSHLEDLEVDGKMVLKIYFK